jgi:hypothetical protein
LGKSPQSTALFRKRHKKFIRPLLCLGKDTKSLSDHSSA